MLENLLQEQVAYYRARAAEYDEWFYRKGRYDHGEELNQQWFDEVAILKQAVHNLSPVQHALELAMGTGIWTEELLPLADHIIAMDASSEMIAISKARLQTDQVTYIQANLFEWQPDRQYDLVFFGHWLSHIPPENLDQFLQMVHKALRPGGRLFILDSRRMPTGTAKDQNLPDEGDYLAQRSLNDGRQFRIVKIFYDPQVLQTKLIEAGFEARVQVTPNYFIYADGRKRDKDE